MNGLTRSAEASENGAEGGRIGAEDGDQAGVFSCGAWSKPGSIGIGAVDGLMGVRSGSDAENALGCSGVWAPWGRGGGPGGPLRGGGLKSLIGQGD